MWLINVDNLQDIESVYYSTSEEEEVSGIAAVSEYTGTYQPNPVQTMQKHVEFFLID